MPGLKVVSAGALAPVVLLAVAWTPAHGARVSGCEASPSIFVTVRGIAEHKGQIVADLHGDDPKTFLKKGAKLSRIRVPVDGGEVSFCIPLDAPGVYALAVYQDVNDNRKFDKNLVGLPKEPFGLSNNPPVRLGRPPLKDAAVTVGVETVELVIVLKS